MKYLRVGFGPSYHKAKWIKVGRREVLSTVCGKDAITWNIAWLPVIHSQRPCKQCFSIKEESVR